MFFSQAYEECWFSEKCVEEDTERIINPSNPKTIWIIRNLYENIQPFFLRVSTRNTLLRGFASWEVREDLSQPPRKFSVEITKVMTFFFFLSACW